MNVQYCTVQCKDWDFGHSFSGKQCLLQNFDIVQCMLICMFDQPLKRQGSNSSFQKFRVCVQCLLHIDREACTQKA